MTGMSAADRIPLLERELLRIQNELGQARRDAQRDQERERLVLAIAWASSPEGKLAIGDKADSVVSSLLKSLSALRD